jgi:hypothetical protein
MAYISDPLEKAISRFIQQDGGSYSFSPPRNTISIPISEVEYHQARSRIKTYSSIAKLISLSIGLALFAAAYWRMASGMPLLPFLIIGSILLLLASLTCTIAARWFALRPLYRRFNDRRHGRKSWRRSRIRGMMEFFRVHKWKSSILILFILASLSIGIHDFDSRTAIFDHGNNLTAYVYRSDDRHTRSICTVQYRYSWKNRSYEGDTTGCVLMRQHPVGSNISIRINPADPRHSVAEGERFWTSGFATPFVFFGLGIFTALIFLVAAASHATRRSRM